MAAKNEVDVLRLVDEAEGGVRLDETIDFGRFVARTKDKRFGEERMPLYSRRDKASVAVQSLLLHSQRNSVSESSPTKISSVPPKMSAIRSFTSRRSIWLRTSCSSEAAIASLPCTRFGGTRRPRTPLRPEREAAEET